MEIKLIFFIMFLPLFLVNCSDEKLSENEKNICLQNFETDLIRFFSVFQGSNNRDHELISVLNLILSDVELNGKVQDSKGEILILANRLLSRSGDEIKKEIKEIDFIKLNIHRFEANQMSLIEDLDFINKLFLAYYWIDWKCDLSFGFDINISSSDTIILYENRAYQMPIFINPEGNKLTLFEISSNSLQKGERDKIFIKTGNAQKEIINQKFQIVGYNVLTGEKHIELDSILLRVIKRD